MIKLTVQDFCFDKNEFYVWDSKKFNEQLEEMIRDYVESCDLETQRQHDAAIDDFEEFVGDSFPFGWGTEFFEIEVDEETYQFGYCEKTECKVIEED